MNILKLPQEYISGRDGNIALTAAELGRLTISGLLDLGTVRQNGQYRSPTPLLLIDGECAREDQDIEDGVRRFFYGPKTVHVPGEDPANPPVELSHTEWAFQVDLPADPKRQPSSYLGHGIYPDEAIATIFNTPLPYDQAIFERAASTWLRELGVVVI